MNITEHEMRGLLTGKCLPGDMRFNEELPVYLVRKFTELKESRDSHMQAEMTWEKSMMAAIGEDGVGCVVKAIAALKEERDVLQTKLAELEKQEHCVEVMKDGPMTVCHWMKPAEELPDGARLFTRPAPAADLAGLVPDECTLDIAKTAIMAEGWTKMEAYMHGANNMRRYILRNIEEANK